MTSDPEKLLNNAYHTQKLALPYRVHQRFRHMPDNAERSTLNAGPGVIISPLSSELFQRFPYV